MAKGSNQKLKLSYLCKIMQEKTDDEHRLTLAQIIKELEKHDITAERKSLYDDFKVMDISKLSGLSQQAVSRMENGTGGTLENIIRYLSSMGYSLSIKKNC